MSSSTKACVRNSPRGFDPSSAVLDGVLIPDRWTAPHWSRTGAVVRSLRPQNVGQYGVGKKGISLGGGDCCCCYARGRSSPLVGAWSGEPVAAVKRRNGGRPVVAVARIEIFAAVFVETTAAICSATTGVLALQAGSCKHHNRRKSPASNGDGFNYRNLGSSLRSLLICPRRQGVPNNLTAFRRFNLLHTVLVYVGDMAWGDAFAVKLIL